MPKHTKPTKEELEANAKKALEEAEALKNNPQLSPSPSLAIPSPSEAIPSPSQAVPSPSPSEPIPSPIPSEPIPSPSPDYKEKFVASSREAQVLHAKNKKVNEAIDKAAELPEPTEEELRAEYSDWEVMSDFEKKLAKDSLISTRRFALLHEATKEFKDIDAWNDKVDKFIVDPKVLVDYSELEGRIEEFKIFATKPTRRGVDFEDLISAFLYDITKKMKPKQKGQMFPTGSGGPNEKPKPGGGKITIEEARTLRKTDYNKFKELLKAGKIESGNF